METRMDGSNHDSASHDAQEIPLKRATRSRYAQQACDECRRRKVRCCGNYPCSRCVSRDDQCAYLMGDHRGDGRSNKRRRTRSALAPSAQQFDINGPPQDTVDSEDSPEHVEERPMEETDTYDMNHCGQGSSVSLRSQLAAAHNSLSIRPPTSSSPAISDRGDMFPRGTSEVEAATKTLSIPLPLRLLELIRIFFEENNPYYPCVPELDFKDRLLDLLKAHGYGSGAHKLNIKPSDASFAALVCVILAFSEFIDPASHSTSHLKKRSQRPGYRWYNQGLGCLEFAKHPKTQNLEIVRFHALETMYLIHIEQLGEASRALVTAIQLAIRLGLNNEKTWTACSDLEMHSRRMLWWSIYYMDRRVSEKCGRPYFLRDTEVDVGDLKPWIQENTPTGVTEGGIPDLKHQLEFHGTLHLQSNVEWSRMWSEIWDTFFALQAKHLGDRDLIKKTDAQLVKMRDSLPSNLTWDTNLLVNYVLEEDEHITRFRLLTVTVYKVGKKFFLTFELINRQKINLLRLILRHNPLADCRDDNATLSLCGDIAKDTIDSIVAYMQTFNTVGQLGVFATSYLVACICFLIPSVTADLPGTQRQTALQALDSARQLLQQISTYHGAAKRAQKVLEHVFDAVNRFSPNDCDGPTTKPCGYGIQGTNSDQPHIMHFGNYDGQHAESAELQGISPFTDAFSADWTADWLVDAFLCNDAWMPEIS